MSKKDLGSLSKKPSKKADFLQKKQSKIEED